MKRTNPSEVIRHDTQLQRWQTGRRKKIHETCRKCGLKEGSRYLLERIAREDGDQRG